MRPIWCQINVDFPDPHIAEEIAVTDVAPIFAEAETDEMITAWFFIRKGAWRMRYLPARGRTETDTYLTDRLLLLNRAGRLTAVTPGRYEPEIHAFGGTVAMEAAHRLWHHDSRYLLAPTTGGEPAHRRELSMMMCAAMLRAACLDRYEQGDVWARVAEHRDPPGRTLTESLQVAVQRLLTVDPASLTSAGAPLAGSQSWIEAYTTTGAVLRRLDRAGQLHRSLRAVLAHHVIFMWNRRGVPGPHQAALATAAKDLVFGPDPAEARTPTDAAS